MESLNHFGNRFNNSFKDKNILITGGTGGIGSKVVQSFIQLGANVCVISRFKDKIDEVFGRLINNKSFSYEILNLEHPSSLRDGFKKIMMKFEGRIDIIVVCHGIFKAGGFFDHDKIEFDSVLNLNTRSVFQLISLATPFLKLSKGNIVAVSSIESFIPVSTSFLNSVSKVCYIYIIYILIYD